MPIANGTSKKPESTNAVTTVEDARRVRRQIAPNRLKQFFLHVGLTVDRKHAVTTGITNKTSQKFISFEQCDV
jgi:hypothetical protein